MDKMPSRIKELYDEIKKLYNLTEPEMVLMTQMSLMIQMLGYSPQLTVKLLKALTAFYEVTVDEMEKEQKK